MPYALAFLLGWLLCTLSVVNGDANSIDYKIEVYPSGIDHRIYKVVYTFNDAFPLKRLHPSGISSFVRAIGQQSKLEESDLGDKDTDRALPVFTYMSAKPGIFGTKNIYGCSAEPGLDPENRISWNELRVVIRTVNEYRLKFFDRFEGQFGHEVPGAVFSVWRVQPYGALMKVAAGYVTRTNPLSQHPESIARGAKDPNEDIPTS